MTLEQTREQANAHRKAKQYSDALPLYDHLWNEDPEQRSVWDGWGLAYCLQKLKQYPLALEVSREVFSLDREFEPIRSVYAWSIYYTELAPAEKPPRQRLLRAAEGVLKLCVQDTYSPYTRTVFTVLEVLKSEKPHNPALLLEWAQRLDPEALSAQASAYTDRDGMQRESASEREKWYGIVCKALFETEQFEACIEHANRALAEIRPLHYGNDVWLARLVARSQAELGHVDEAIEGYLGFLSRKPDAFLREELAHLYARKEDATRALRYAGEAALAPGDLDKKVKLFDFLSHLLHENGQEEAARTHVELELRVRQDAEWKISADLHAWATTLGVDAATARPAKELVRELRPFWESLKFEGQERQSGTVANLLPHGKAGFIRAESGSSYYFQLRNVVGKRANVQPDQHVTFYVEESFDPVKQRKSEVAVDIRLA